MSGAMEFLGSGWGFPVRPGTDGALPVVGGPDSVARSLVLILETEPGERIMRPGFGCGLRRHLMKPNTVATRALIRREVERAVVRWEPRIELESVAVEPGDDPALVLIRIAWVLARNRSPGNLVYPFYLE